MVSSTLIDRSDNFLCGDYGIINFDRYFLCGEAIIFFVATMVSSILIDRSDNFLRGDYGIINSDDISVPAQAGGGAV